MVVEGCWFVGGGWGGVRNDPVLWWWLVVGGLWWFLVPSLSVLTKRGLLLYSKEQQKHGVVGGWCWVKGKGVPCLASIIQRGAFTMCRYTYPPQSTAFTVYTYTYPTEQQIAQRTCSVSRGSRPTTASFIMSALSLCTLVYNGNSANWFTIGIVRIGLVYVVDMAMDLLYIHIQRERDQVFTCSTSRGT